MYQIGTVKYSLCLFDTNALSFIIKNKERLKRLFDRYQFPDYLYVYSPYVIYEIGKNKSLIDDYKKFFSFFPSLLLKNEVELFNELRSEEENHIQPVIWGLNPAAIKGEGESLFKLNLLFSLAGMDKHFKEIEEKVNRNYIIMKEWAEWGRKYIGKQRRKIIEYRIVEAFGANLVASYTNIKGMDKDQFKKLISNKIVQAISYAWYFKFISDKNRKSTVNDVVDIYNIAAISQCDVFIGENNICDILGKMKTMNIIQDIKIERASSFL